MTKFLDNLYKNFAWIIIAISLVAYLAYQVLDFQGDIKTVVLDWQTWVHTLFVIWLQIMIVSGAYDSGVSAGINSKEFELADKLNNKIITSVNNEMSDFRKYVKKLNDHELQIVREDFLFKIGDKKIEELTKSERRKFNKLSALRHDIYGFNLPLFYELSKNGTIKYQASVKKNQGKLWKQIKKVASGVLFAGMTVNVAFSLRNVGPALISLLIIGAGLGITFVLTFFPQVHKFRVDLPKKVIQKKTLYDSYIEWKNGTHKLNRLELIDNTKPSTEDKPTTINDKKDNLLTERPASPQFDTLKNNPLGI